MRSLWIGGRGAGLDEPPAAASISRPGTRCRRPPTTTSPPTRTRSPSIRHVSREGRPISTPCVMSTPHRGAARGQVRAQRAGGAARGGILARARVAEEGARPRGAGLGIRRDQVQADPVVRSPAARAMRVVVRPHAAQEAGSSRTGASTCQSPVDAAWQRQLGVRVGGVEADRGEHLAGIELGARTRTAPAASRRGRRRPRPRRRSAGAPRRSPACRSRSPRRARARPRRPCRATGARRTGSRRVDIQMRLR